MVIGIVIAVPEELKCFLNSKYDVIKTEVDFRNVYSIKVNNNDVYLTTSGYGQIDAASATQFLITKYNCQAIFNYGVTGAMRGQLQVNDVFVVSKAVNYDYDISQIENVKPHQYLGFADEFIPLDNYLIEQVKQIYPNIKLVNVASGEKFVEKIEDKTHLAESLNCDICDMEIAAISKTATRNHVPCLSIKSISDTLYGTGKDYHENVEFSANQAFNILQVLLETL